MTNEMSARDSRSIFRAYLALAAGVLCIGFSAIFVKWAGVSGPISAFYRVLFAAIVVTPWRFFRQTGLPTGSDTLWILAGGAFFAFDLVLWNTSLLLTSATTATLLANNAPLWVGIASIFFFREHLPARYWLGLVIALCGMTFLVGSTVWQQLRFNTGDLLALGASFAYAMYLLTTQRVRVRVDTLTFMTISVVSSTLLLFAFNLILGMRLTGYSTKTWVALIGMGLISHLGGWLAINYALGHIRAAPASVGLLSQAVVTALLAIPLLGEFLTIYQIAGGTLVLGGIYFANHR